MHAKGVTIGTLIGFVIDAIGSAVLGFTIAKMIRKRGCKCVESGYES